MRDLTTRQCGRCWTWTTHVYHPATGAYRCDPCAIRAIVAAADDSAQTIPGAADRPEPRGDGPKGAADDGADL